MKEIELLEAWSEVHEKHSNMCHDKVLLLQTKYQKTIAITCKHNYSVTGPNLMNQY